MRKRLLIILLMIMMIQPVVPVGASNMLTPHSHYTECDWPETYQDNDDWWALVQPYLPAGTTPKNTDGYRFNYRHWHDKGIVVYGTPSTVYGNEWKNVTQTGGPANPVVTQNAGYYNNNGQSGEWRYHGFTISGGMYSNINFPNDSGAAAIGQKRWVAEPWATSPKLENVRSVHNMAVTDTGNTRTQAWMRKVTDGWGEGTVYRNNPERYFNVLSPPTPWLGGQLRGWYNTASGSSRYQTFDIEPYYDKVAPPVTVTTDFFDTEPPAFFDDAEGGYDNTEVAVKIRVTAVLEDTAYVNDPVEKINYFTRLDIDRSKGDNGWNIVLDGQKPERTDGADNIRYAYFTVKMTVAQIKALQNDGTNFWRSLSGQAKVYFHVPGYVTGNPSRESSKDFTTSVTYTRVVRDVGGITALLEATADPNAINGGATGNVQVTLDAHKSFSFLDGKPGTISLYRFWVSKSQADLLNDSKGMVKDTSITIGTVSDVSPNTTLYCKVRVYDAALAQTGLNAVDEYVTTITIGEKNKTPPLPSPSPVVVAPQLNVPEIAFDIVPFVATDNTDMASVKDKHVYIDGSEVQYTSFFSGAYMWGESAVGMHRVDIAYTSSTGQKAGGTEWVYVYSTKPYAGFEIAGSYKVNRKMTLTDKSPASNTQLVIDRYPITDRIWTLSQSGTDLKVRTSTETDKYKEFLCRKPGTYSLSLQVKNNLGRLSDPYTVDITIMDDYAPATICNLDASVLARNEQISSYAFESVSTDNDSVNSISIDLWYDSDNNGTYDQKLNSWDGKNGLPAYTPTKLGKYKYVITSIEEFGEETLPEFVTSADRKESIVQKEFQVDNYVPMTDIYINIPIVRPNVDIYIMLDKNLDSTKTQWVLDNVMNMNNTLRRMNILPQVKTWDMKAYTYSQAASTSVHTGSSYPSATTTYSSNGYTGTLSRTSVSDNGSWSDQGHYETKTETTTTTASLSGKYWNNGSGQPPSTYNGMSRTSVSYYDPVILADGTSYRTWVATYSGTTTTTTQVWVPNMVYTHSYTGYYSGTIYKDVRQDYTAPWRGNSSKYVVYVTDNTISELSDMQMVLRKCDAQLIVAGATGAQSQISSSKFILNNKGISSVMDDVLAYVGQESPSGEQLVVQAGVDTFTVSTANFDHEGDPLTRQEFLYIENQNYFDNPTGMDTNAVSAFSDTAGWTTMLKNKFNTIGEFKIYRRIKDQPTTDPNFSGYAYFSGTPYITVYAHRKPIASATLDWDYDPSRSVYKTRWVDNSYDLDHNISRADKGIVERKTMFRQNGGEWQYYIPSELTTGSYELQYTVRDLEGAWSDPFTMNFTLSPAPPMQFDASLRTLDSDFSLSGIPASEYLEVYNAWTRYPYNVKLEMAMYNGSTRVTPLQTVNYSTSTGSKTGNDIAWNNINYQVPATLPDGTYTFKVSAVDTSNSSIRIDKNFTVTVSTPVNLTPDMPAQLITGHASDIKATTSKYANTTQARLFNGTPYQITLNLTGALSGNRKAWIYNYTVPGNIPDGNYTAVFTSFTPNGNSQTGNVNFRVESLKITSVTISGYWNHWRGQIDMFAKQLTNEPHRFLSLECVRININTTGNADRLEIDFSPELTAMQYTDPNGNIYDYKNDYFGYYVSFPKVFILDGNKKDNTKYWEYYLPLAPSTKDFGDKRLRSPYSMTVKAYKGSSFVTYTINDIEITANVYDLTYIQPVN